MQMGEDDISREIRLKREKELVEDRPSRVEVLKAKLEISERLLKEYRKENTAMKNELLWIIEDVWPLVHHLTSRQTLKARFLRLRDFME